MGEIGAVAKFLQYISSLLAEPSLATWRARKQVEAQRILALGEAEVAEIREVGAARASAKAMLELAGASQSLLEQMGREIDQRIESHFDKRLNNLAQIVARAERALPPGQVPDVEPDMAWTSSFSQAAQDISDEDMQELWARVLAGEVEKPGSTSVMTLGVLRNLDQRTAQLFKRLCSMAVSLSVPEGHCLDHRLVSFGGNFSGNSFQGFGIRFTDLLDLSEHGLIISELKTQSDYRVCIGLPGNLVPGRQLPPPFMFQGQRWVLIRDGEWDFEKEFWVPGSALTKAGRELSKVVELEPVPKYAEALKGYFAEKGLDMVQV
ncbi:MAG: DUF2806 domain-containing protein [Gemmatimonadetes bacterium]|nr:DUF2806 domain-containing protein [Gemmatimonadota bacterium]